MSGTAGLEAAFYKVISVAAKGDPVTGVDLAKPASQPVHINARAIHIWKITPRTEPGVYRLSLGHSYPFTGVDDEHRVIATAEATNDKEWCIKYWKEHGGACTIELNTLFWPASAWTLASKGDPDSKIVIGHYEVHPHKTQLFKLEPFRE